MPRRATATENKWLHTSYVYAWCYKKREYIYTSVHGFRQSTGLLWDLKNKKEAMKLLNQRLQTYLYKDSKVQHSEQPDMMTIDDAYKLFKDEELNNMKQSTIAQYKIIYTQFMVINYYLTQTSEIKAMIMSVRDKLLETKAANTVWKRMQRIHKFFTYCVNQGFIDRNPISPSMIPKYQDKQKLIITEEELQLILSKMNHPELVLFVRMAAITAMRIEELMQLTWGDIDHERILIHGKGDRLRIFPIRPFPELAEIIENLRQFQTSNKVFRWKNQQTPRKLFNKAKEAAQIADWESKTFHSIRKGTMNVWRKKGIDIETRSELAGNSVPVQFKNYILNPDVEYFEEKLKNK